MKTEIAAAKSAASKAQRGLLIAQQDWKQQQKTRVEGHGSGGQVLSPCAVLMHACVFCVVLLCVFFLALGALVNEIATWAQGHC